MNYKHRNNLCEECYIVGVPKSIVGYEWIAEFREARSENTKS